MELNPSFIATQPKFFRAYQAAYEHYLAYSGIFCITKKDSSVCTVGSELQDGMLSEKKVAERCERCIIAVVI